MIDESSMRELVLKRALPLSAFECELDEVLNGYAAESLTAQRDSPAFDNSMFDGYALSESDLRSDAVLHLSGEQAAGPDHGLNVKNGECIRIFTGAPLPENTAAVIMQEDTVAEGNKITLRDTTERNFGIRRQGADVCKGQKILRAGQRITPALVGLLASQGFTRIAIGRKPRISILCTGNEIRPAGENLKPGEIHESNGAMLSALFKNEASSTPGVTLVSDSLEAIREAIREKSENQDVLLISGGMSVGEYDFVPRALKEEGFEIEGYKVRVKPGKPFLFGTRGRQLVFGFPGNPVSAYLTALIFARPAILRLAGAEESELGLPISLATVEKDIQNPDDRPHYMRGNLQNGSFTPTGLQQSHALFGLSQSNAIVRISEKSSLRSGETIPVFLLP
ncbi:MAG: gephyrin-like molybdotransferase Glp [Chthoniobacterales bacterium]